MIEFDSVQSAIATFESPGYRAARKILEGAAERDIRILERILIGRQPGRLPDKAYAKIKTQVETYLAHKGKVESEIQDSCQAYGR